MVKILVVGSNPSQKSLDNTSFHPSTRSRSILDEWFKGMDVSLSFINVSDQKKEDNKPLTSREIESGLPDLKLRLSEYEDHKLIAVGKVASKALTLLCLDFHELPHPSGLNRKLNDKVYVASFLEDLRKYCSECTKAPPQSYPQDEASAGQHKAAASHQPGQPTSA